MPKHIHGSIFPTSATAYPWLLWRVKKGRRWLVLEIPQCPPSIATSAEDYHLSSSRKEGEHVFSNPLEQHMGLIATGEGWELFSRRVFFVGGYRGFAKKNNSPSSQKVTVPL